MPTLHAGRREDGKFRVINLTESQMEHLGFQPGEQPIKVGCGTKACAYLPTKQCGDEAVGTDTVVKITKDPRDAITSQLLRSLDPFPLWAIPIYAIYRLPKSTFVIVAAKAERLADEWADPIDVMFEYTADEEEHGPGGLRAYEWDGPRGYAGILTMIERRKMSRGGATTREDDLMRRALELVNDAVLALRELGLDWADFDSTNWGMYQGRPVILDFGRLSALRPGQIPGADLSQAPKHPVLRSIPVLPF